MQSARKWQEGSRDLPSGSKKKLLSIDDIPAESCLHCYPFSPAGLFITSSLESGSRLIDIHSHLKARLCIESSPVSGARWHDRPLRRVLSKLGRQLRRQLWASPVSVNQSPGNAGPTKIII
ncbi:hypothetical protein CEXT_27341 [Caerostris extrusa]|uniref:Uncharacterized protein n=1 Tax=Caerostris extrusa TaxID=172846 RepID=A0AAV4WZV0_CAEEX|nr:hypothetical protein CEXT_27341 [Caerostris extrusa]